MMSDYIYLGVAVVVGICLVMLVMYLIYRRGIGLRLAAIVGATEEPVKVECERCRVRRLQGTILPPVLDGADDCGRDVGRSPDCLEEIGRAGLAVGAGEAGQGQVTIRVPEELRRQQRRSR